MIRYIIILVSVLILAGIFFRKYLIVEKNVSFKSLFFRHKHIVKPVVDKENVSELSITEIIPDVESVDEKNRVKADSFIRKSDIYFGKGDVVNAEKSLIQALALDPSSIEAYKRLGALYLNQGQFSKAENIYKKLIATVHDDPLFFSNMGIALYSQNKLEDAIKHYEKAIELDSSKASRFFSLGQIYYELENMEKALSLIKTAVDKMPDNVDYLLTLAHLYDELNMVDEAKDTANSVILLNPDEELIVLAEKILKSAMEKSIVKNENAEQDKVVDDDWNENELENNAIDEYEVDEKD